MPVAIDLFIRKVHYVLHRAFVEARNLALQGKTEQLYAMADAFEIIPGLLADLNEESQDTIRCQVQAYQTRFGTSTFDYLAILDMPDEDFTDILSQW